MAKNIKSIESGGFALLKDGSLRKQLGNCLSVPISGARLDNCDRRIGKLPIILSLWVPIPNLQRLFSSLCGYQLRSAPVRSRGISPRRAPAGDGALPSASPDGGQLEMDVSWPISWLANSV